MNTVVMQLQEAGNTVIVNRTGSRALAVYVDAVC